MGFLCANVHKTHAQGGFKWTVTHLGGMNNSKMKMWCFFCSNKLDIKEILCISSTSNRTSLLSYGHQSVYIVCVCVFVRYLLSAGFNIWHRNSLGHLVFTHFPSLAQRRNSFQNSTFCSCFKSPHQLIV